MSAAPDPTVLDEMERLWAGGADAARAAPASWRAAIGDATGAEAELRLLALAGQAHRMALRPAPRGDAPRPLLPPLSLPTVPDALRPLVRAALDAVDRARETLVLDLLATRGMTTHPMDWLPGPADAVPAAYAPWRDWGAGVASDAVLTVETWDALPPAPRLDRLRALRRADPDAARALLAGALAGEPADARADLVAALAVGLSDADAALLAALETDRSGKVRREARRLLGRLGQLPDAIDPEILRPVIETAKGGLLRNRTVLRPARKRGQLAPAKGDREVLDGVSLAALARALGTTPHGFLDAWAWDQSPLHDAVIARIVAETGDDAAVGLTLDRAIASANPSALRRLAPRMDRDARDAMLRAFMARAWNALPPQMLRVLGDLPEPLRGRPAPLTARSPLLDTLVSEGLARPGPTPADPLHMLGLVLPAAEARTALDALTGAGLARTDPALALLRLTAALPDPTGDRP